MPSSSWLTLSVATDIDGTNVRGSNVGCWRLPIDG